MFSGRFDSKAAEDGSYFIDRDGTHFRYILNYLRAGQLVVPEDKIVRREHLNEAEFYRVQGIIDELRSQPFEGSLILSTEHRQILTNWLHAKLTSASFTYTLIYRASAAVTAGTKSTSIPSAIAKDRLWQLSRVGIKSSEATLSKVGNVSWFITLSNIFYCWDPVRGR